jgi:hypothetical protein
MRTFKQILAIIVIVLCVLGILGAAAGIVGVWQANGPVTEALVKTASGLRTVVGGIGEGLDRLSEHLGTASSAIALVEDTVTVAGETLAGSTPVLELLTRIFGEQLLPSVSAGLETARSLGEAALAVNSALETVNTLPLTSVPTLPTELTELAQDLVDLESQVKQGAQEVRNMKVAAVDSVVTPITDRADQMQSRVDSAAAKAAAAADRLAKTEMALAVLRDRLPLYIDLASIAATLVLGWLILAQMSLLLHARDLMRRVRAAPQIAAEAQASAGDSRP